MRFPLFIAILLAAGSTASAQNAASRTSGDAVYKQRCAGCHEQINPRIPPRTALNQMPAGRILRTLDFGAMMTIAYPSFLNGVRGIGLLTQGKFKGP